MGLLSFLGTKEEISPKVSNKKGKKEGSKEKVVEQFSDFRVEYSKSSRAACRGCLEKIPKVINQA